MKRAEARMTAVRTPSPEFVTAARAAQLLGCSRRLVVKLTLDGHLGTVKLPGAPTRYQLDDVLRLRERSLRPATADLSRSA